MHCVGSIAPAIDWAAPTNQRCCRLPGADRNAGMRDGSWPHAARPGRQRDPTADVPEDLAWIFVCSAIAAA